MITDKVSTCVTDIDLSDPSDSIFLNECKRYDDAFSKYIDDMVNRIDYSDALEVQFTDKISSCDT